jgi:hypothetical protein
VIVYHILIYRRVLKALGEASQSYSLDGYANGRGFVYEAIAKELFLNRQYSLHNVLRRHLPIITRR